MKIGCLMRQPRGYCFGGIRNATTLARAPAATRLSSTVAGGGSRFRGLVEYRTSRLCILRAERGVMDCGRVPPRRFSQTPLRYNAAESAGHKKAPPVEGIVEPTDGRPSGGRKSTVVAIISFTVGLLYALIPDDSPNRSKSSSALNDESFRKFTVVSNEQISPTSFILTVKPFLSSDEKENAEVIRKAWEHGLWSVEIKQPQLQIARHYTPLPSVVPLQEGDGATLRFLIRRYEGGEVSKYLSRLQGQGQEQGSSGAGDVVELRGPHLGFDVAARLADAGRNVVFLAGGTGIAPALQLARRMLSVPGSEGLSVRIFWANRSASDCVGCPRLDGQKGRSWRIWSTGDSNSDEYATHGAPGPIVQQLRDLEAAYRQKGSSTLDFKCIVDEEGSRINAGDIMTAVRIPPSQSTQTLSPPAATPDKPSSSSCYLHSQRLLHNSTEDADAQEEKNAQDSGTRICNCTVPTGKNLFMISGPDGFVGAYVGPKVWAAGAERQGPVGGVVGELRKRDHKPWRDWLVLKQ
ncbi:Cytochrome c mitochondrial import factor CYC2 [Cytospora mali]|uniref:Cytochrome c mitochondrial import factor CYC2 n=1 Tax=Cytospora mali TaxID=578113 RepID=A0A194W6V0_CYTMA|nr:Cytochrome c mitochondrial import factor CYC2 [Valsa mali]